MVSDKLLDEQAKADIERTKALTREVESRIKLNELDMQIKQKQLKAK